MSCRNHTISSSTTNDGRVGFDDFDVPLVDFDTECKHLMSLGHTLSFMPVHFIVYLMYDKSMSPLNEPKCNLDSNSRTSSLFVPHVLWSGLEMTLASCVQIAKKSDRDHGVNGEFFSLKVNVDINCPHAMMHDLYVAIQSRGGVKAGGLLHCRMISQTTQLIRPFNQKVAHTVESWEHTHFSDLMAMNAPL